MLVLSRKCDEQIMIGQDIVVTVVEIRGDKVRLGIEAPSHVPVHRQEVYLNIQRAKSAGTGTQSIGSPSIESAKPDTPVS